MSELQHEWYEKNKAKIHKTRNERCQTDPHYKMTMSYRSALSAFVSGKRRKTVAELGCDREQLTDWFSFLFQEGMSMDNYGSEWVVDHVISVSYGLNDNHELFDIISKWYNVVPTTRSYNLKKNKHSDIKQIGQHIANLGEYFELRGLDIDQDYMELLARHLVAGNP
jgi:hypothetical protein